MTTEPDRHRNAAGLTAARSALTAAQDTPTARRPRPPALPHDDQQRSRNLAQIARLRATDHPRPRR